MYFSNDPNFTVLGYYLKIAKEQIQHSIIEWILYKIRDVSTPF